MTTHASLLHQLWACLGAEVQGAPLCVCWEVGIIEVIVRTAERALLDD